MSALDAAASRTHLLLHAFRPSQPSTTVPPETLDEATRADHARRGRTGGLRSRWRR